MSRVNYSPGNRLKVPAELGPHFCYRTAAPRFKPTDVETVVAAVCSYGDRAVGPNEEVIDPDRAFKRKPRAQQALERLVDAVRSFTKLSGEVLLVTCEGTEPQVNDYYAGQCWYSVVLHTGPQGYILYTMHTQPLPKGLTKVIKTRRMMSVGEAFVWDPTTPYMLESFRPRSGQRLVLLQMLVDDQTLAKRRALMKRLPPSVPGQA